MRPTWRQAVPDGDAGWRVRLSGSITRTAMPKAGGKGPLYIAVFEGNPVVDGKKKPCWSAGPSSTRRTWRPPTPVCRIASKASRRAPKERQVLAFLTTTAPPYAAQPRSRRRRPGDPGGHRQGIRSRYRWKPT